MLYMFPPRPILFTKTELSELMSTTQFTYISSYNADSSAGLAFKGK